MYYIIVSFGMQQVVEDSGEGRFFLCRLERGSIEKSGPGTTGKRRGVAAFLHNVIIVHLMILL
jgi:hypothetical protein